MIERKVVFCPGCGKALDVPVVVHGVSRPSEGWVTVSFRVTSLEHSCPDPTRDATRGTTFREASEAGRAAADTLARGSHAPRFFASGQKPPPSPCGDPDCSMPSCVQ